MTPLDWTIVVLVWLLIPGVFILKHYLNRRARPMSPRDLADLVRSGIITQNQARLYLSERGYKRELDLYVPSRTIGQTYPATGVLLTKEPITATGMSGGSGGREAKR